MPARAEGGSKLVPDLERGISKKTLFPNHSPLETLRFSSSGSPTAKRAKAKFTPPLRVNSERGGAVEKAFVKGSTPLSPLVRGAFLPPPRRGASPLPP